MSARRRQKRRSGHACAREAARQKGPLVGPAGAAWSLLSRQRAVGAGASRAKHRLVEKSWTGMELGRRLTGGNLSIIFAGGARVLPLASEPEQGAAPYIQGKHLCR